MWGEFSHSGRHSVFIRHFTTLYHMDQFDARWRYLQSGCKGYISFYTRARPMPTFVTRAPVRTTEPATMALPMNICA